MKNTTYTIYHQKPLDISSIKVENRNSNIGKVINMIRDKDIELSFSDDNDTWNSEKKNQFLETVLIGLPIPSFFFYIDDNSGKWLIIDGEQRLRTLYDYIVNKNVAVNKFDLLNENKFNKSFDELPYSTRLDVKMRPVSLNIISGINSPEAKYTIFKRYNNKNHILTPAEIRHNLFPGNANHIIEEMSNLDIFKKLICSKIESRQRIKEEYVSRFITFYLNDFIYHNENLELIIVSTYEILNKEFDINDTIQLLDNFENSLYTCYKMLGENAFSHPNTKEISINLFETLTVPIAKLTALEQDLLIGQKESFKCKYMALFKDESFVKLVSSKNNYKKIKSSINIIQKLIRNIIQK